MKAAGNFIIGANCNRLKLIFIQLAGISFDSNIPKSMVRKFWFKNFCSRAGTNINIGLFSMVVRERVEEIPVFVQRFPVFKSTPIPSNPMICTLI